MANSGRRLLKMVLNQSTERMTVGVRAPAER